MSSQLSPGELGAARGRRANLNLLTSMRGIAALSVFLFHMTAPDASPFTGKVASDLTRWGANLGYVGVSFFFVLSGFVLTWSARPGERTRSFWRRRAVKIFPNHVVTFAVAMLLFASAATTWHSWLPNLLLVQNWSRDPATFFSVNVPSWSLSCEIFFYLLFPLLLRGALRIRAERLWAWAGGVAALAVAMPAIVYATMASHPFMGPGYPVNARQLWFVYVFPPVRLLEFVLGMLMARIVIEGKWLRIGRLPATVLLVAAYVISLHVPILYTFEACVVVPFALLVPAAAVADTGGKRSILRSRAAVWFGEVSFAFYMVQALVIEESWKLYGPDLHSGLPGAIGLVALWLVICLVLAELLRRCVEAPMMRHFSRSRRAPLTPGGQDRITAKAGV
ncbi:acyltransferase family protein [Streptomyces sp. NRRL F-5123]|uniref:acyltransferase family protein n=1 Tax=Streptomyces sp. NRRL F-5123 TaxID=1463856 RepID=UPI00099CD8E4|nr:acyltransferase [Streptomyces sp. NRRL F-5123]